VRLLKTGKIVEGQIRSSWFCYRGEDRACFVRVAFCDSVNKRVQTVKVNKDRFSRLPKNTLVHVICYPGHRNEALVLEGL
jgi:hypothetical protein